MPARRPSALVGLVLMVLYVGLPWAAVITLLHLIGLV